MVHLSPREDTAPTGSTSWINRTPRTENLRLDCPRSVVTVAPEAVAGGRPGDSPGLPNGAAFLLTIHAGRDKLSRLMTSSTEITLVDGGRYRVEGDATAVEQTIVDAARGSIMELAWFNDAASGERLGINPDCVVTLRAVGS